MNFIIKQRAIMLGNHILKTKQTLRQTAKVYGLSKSTVHHDVSKKLRMVDPNLYLKVKIILKKNFGEKHIRGGQATRLKYLRNQH